MGYKALLQRIPLMKTLWRYMQCLGGFSGLMKEEGNVLEDDLEKVAVYG